MNADRIDEPILLIHGSADDNSGTFPIQSERFFAALKGLGGTARLVMLPMESHSYRHGNRSSMFCGKPSSGLTGTWSGLIDGSVPGGGSILFTVMFIPTLTGFAHTHIINRRIKLLKSRWVYILSAWAQSRRFITW